MTATRSRTLASAVASTRRAARKSGAAVHREVEELLEAFANRAADAREALVDVAGEGAVTARRSLDAAVRETRRGMRRLDRKWQKMDATQKAAVVSAALAALAAAAATPVLIRKARRTK